MRMRWVLFQLHWLLGISAGVVLALVGLTGALLSYEDALLRIANPGALSVVAQGEPLSTAALLERVAAQRPGAAVQALTRRGDPTEPATIVFVPAAGPSPDGRGPRGERLQVDPYSGALLPPPRGEGFFRTAMQLHRWLLAGDVGKQVVGASTVALLFFCLSGLYLRWPRGRALSPRAWLALDWGRRGRRFLWQLHAIIGTWVLLAFLVMGASGLWWSYGWYRSALQSWAGMAPPVAAASPAAAARAGAGQQPGASPADLQTAPAPASPTGEAAFDPAAAWLAFERAVPAWREATLRWPERGASIQLRYLGADAPHERAVSTIDLQPGTLAVQEHLRYQDKPLRQRLVGSMFALHRGSFFGPLGTVVFMLASLCMPLFAITGWMLYLDRRRRRVSARQRVREAVDDAGVAVAATLSVRRS